MEDNLVVSEIIDIDEFCYYRRISRLDEEPDDTPNLKVLIETRLSRLRSQELSPTGVWLVSDPPWDRYYQGFSLCRWETYEYHKAHWLKEARAARQYFRERPILYSRPIVQGDQYCTSDFDTPDLIIANEVEASQVKDWTRTLETLDKIKHFAPCWYRCAFHADTHHWKYSQNCISLALQDLCVEACEIWNLEVKLAPRLRSHRFCEENIVCGCDQPNLHNRDERHRCLLIADLNNFEYFNHHSEDIKALKFLHLELKRGGYGRVARESFESGWEN